MQLTKEAKMATAAPLHEMPFTRLELVVLSLVDGRLSVLLGKRAQAPYAGRWALPGGVLRIDLDDDLEAAVQRIAGERLQTELPYVRQLVAVGSKKRDRDRAPWALSIVYRALLPLEFFKPQAGKRLEELKWFDVDEEPAKANLAFDHHELVVRAVQETRRETEELHLPAGFLPQTFTLGELQAICEHILGRSLDKSSFRRKLDQRQLVQPVAGLVRGGANRPAQMYRLTP
jgi:8-oxo-dGTP diphosphatase